MRNRVRCVTIGVAGGAVLLVGIGLLVLPSPGLLLVLATEFPALKRYVDPVRDRAMKAAEDSVSSPLWIAGSVLAGVLLIGAGNLWGLVRDLPLGGWSTGSSLLAPAITFSGCRRAVWRQPAVR